MPRIRASWARAARSLRRDLPGHPAHLGAPLLEPALGLLELLVGVLVAVDDDVLHGQLHREVVERLGVQQRPDGTQLGVTLAVGGGDDLPQVTLLRLGLLLALAEPLGGRGQPLAGLAQLAGQHLGALPRGGEALGHTTEPGAGRGQPAVGGAKPAGGGGVVAAGLVEVVLAAVDAVLDPVLPVLEVALGVGGGVGQGQHSDEECDQCQGTDDALPRRAGEVAHRSTFGPGKWTRRPYDAEVRL